MESRNNVRMNCEGNNLESVTLISDNVKYYFHL